MGSEEKNKSNCDSEKCRFEISMRKDFQLEKTTKEFGKDGETKNINHDKLNITHVYCNNTDNINLSH